MLNRTLQHIVKIVDRYYLITQLFICSSSDLVEFIMIGTIPEWFLSAEFNIKYRQRSSLPLNA